MTIEEAIRQIDLHNYIHQIKEPRAFYITEALNVAIDVMNKYQKIEQLIADYEENKWERIDVKDIREIIDGNVD